MEIRQLETFVHVAQLQSFSRAAEVLGYTQSAITVQIRLLENELETRLFDRTGKRVVLTPSGKEFMGHASRKLCCAERFNSPDMQWIFQFRIIIH